MKLTLPLEFTSPSSNQTGLTNEKFLVLLEPLKFVKSQEEHQLISQLLLKVPGFHEFIRDIFNAACDKVFNYNVDESAFRNIIYNTINNDPSSKHWLSTYGLRLLFDILPKLKLNQPDEYSITAMNPYEENVVPKWCKTRKATREEDSSNEYSDGECSKHAASNEDELSLIGTVSESLEQKNSNFQECMYCNYTTKSGHLKRHIESKHKDVLRKVDSFNIEEY